MKDRSEEKGVRRCVTYDTHIHTLCVCVCVCVRACARVELVNACQSFQVVVCILRFECKCDVHCGATAVLANVPVGKKEIILHHHHPFNSQDVQ